MIVGLALAAGSASAHDVWANGETVPEWVKKACCGPADAHHLTAGQVHILPDGFRVDGYFEMIPKEKAQPSADGDYWIFYRTLSNGQQSMVYCFYAPLNGT
jgi:hypothetical protein